MFIPVPDSIKFGIPYGSESEHHWWFCHMPPKLSGHCLEPGKVPTIPLHMSGIESSEMTQYLSSSCTKMPMK